jgi:hypothetical protein
MRIANIGLAFLWILAIAGHAAADPLPTEILKFQQLPLNSGLPIIAPYSGPYLNTNGFPIPNAATVGAPFPGHDEASTAYSTTANPNSYQGQFMADDFADKFTDPVVHVRWWGSYINGQPPAGGGVKQFLISFESDVPAVPGASPSHPGTPLLNQIVTLGPLAPASGTFTEAIVPGSSGPDGPLYQYNAELNLGKFFPENQPPDHPNTIYWLKIVALADPTQSNLVWGWHDRDWSIPNPLASVPPAVVPGEGIEGLLPSGAPVYHFQDDAVSGTVLITPGADPRMPIVQQSGFTTHNYLDAIDGPTGIGQFSKDLAFELYTVPEPASIVLLGLGAAGLAALRWRRLHST